MSPSLADFFPEKHRKELFYKNLDIGSVFRVELKEIGKPKFYVVVGISNQDFCIANLFINTEINEKVFPSPYLKSLHLKLLKKNYGFLEHDSFLCCADLKEIKIDRLEKIFLNDIQCFTR